MYKVEKLHHRKMWRNGDLESEIAVEDARAFKTKKEAESYILSQPNYNVTKTKSCFYGIRFTGVEWTNENTGEKCEEYYQLLLKKS